MIGPDGLRLIKDAESCRLTAYLDPKGIPTIGWGHTGAEVHLGLTITQATADQWLFEDLARFDHAVGSLVQVPLTQQMRDALLSLTYNIGAGALAGSTLLRLLNDRQYLAAAKQFVQWDDPGRPEELGLLRRRYREGLLFVQGMR